MALLLRMTLLASLIAMVFPDQAQAQARRLFKFDEEKIIGELHKPEVMVVITRQNLEGTYTLELRESFLPKIVDSVEQHPF